MDSDKYKVLLNSYYQGLERIEALEKEITHLRHTLSHTQESLRLSREVSRRLQRERDSLWLKADVLESEVTQMKNIIEYLKQRGKYEQT